MAKKVLSTILWMGVAVVATLACVRYGSDIVDTIQNGDKVVDDSRIAVSVKGHASDDRQVNLYMFTDHPLMSESKYQWAWPGITPEKEYKKEGFEFITLSGRNTYTVELTDFLPLEYTNFTDFVESGGSLKVIVSVPSDDHFDLYQSSDIELKEAGNHYISAPNDSGFVTHSVVNFYIDDSKPTTSNSSVTEPSSTEEQETSSEEITEHTYSLVGTMNDWDVTNNDYLLEYTEDEILYGFDGSYYYIRFTYASSSLKFKVIRDNSYDWCLDGNNLEKVLNPSETAVESSGEDADGNISINLNLSAPMPYVIKVFVDVESYKVRVAVLAYNDD